MLSREQQDLIVTSARANVTTSYAQNMIDRKEALQNMLDINRDNDNPDNDLILESLRSASNEFIESRAQDDNFFPTDRQDYQSVLSAYQQYLESDRDYWHKFTSNSDRYLSHNYLANNYDSRLTWIICETSSLSNQPLRYLRLAAFSSGSVVSKGWGANPLTAAVVTQNIDF